MEKAFEWLRKGSRATRLLKVSALAALFYWCIHFFSAKFKVAEAIFALIVYYALILWARQRNRSIVRSSGIEQLDEMSDEDGSLRTRMHLEGLGWSVESACAKDGWGADFLCVDNQGRKRAVGFRRADGELGLEGIQALSAAVRHYGADRGLFITTGHVSEKAKMLATSNQVEVWDRQEFARSLLQTQRL